MLKLTTVTPGLSPEMMAAALNANFRAIENENRTQIINDETGTPRILFGYHAGGFGTEDNGLKISKEGIDVTKATISDLLFTTAQADAIRILGSGTTSLTKTASNDAASVTVEHDFTDIDTTPFVIAFWSEDGSQWENMPTVKAVTTGTHAGKLWMTMDFIAIGNEIVFQMTTPDFAGNGWFSNEQNVDIQYYVCLPTASS